MLARLSAFVIWAAIAASAVYWLLRLGAGSVDAPPHTTALAAGTAVRGDLSRLLGGSAPIAAPLAAAPVESAGRYRLVGVVAPRTPSTTQGVALIEIDGKPARPFRVGGAVDGATLLQSVHSRGALLGPRGGDAEVKLELPLLPAPATGTRGMAEGMRPVPPRPLPQRVPVPMPEPPPQEMRPPPEAMVPPPDMPDMVQPPPAQ
jgi:general secretion pathway protein C